MMILAKENDKISINIHTEVLQNFCLFNCTGRIQPFERNGGPNAFKKTVFRKCSVKYPLWSRKRSRRIALTSSISSAFIYFASKNELTDYKRHDE